MSYWYLSIVGTEVWWPGLIMLGMFVGFLTGLFGVGGGFILTPCLKILFGIPYPIAVGSGLAQIFVTGGVSAWKHWKNGNVDLKLGIIMSGGALCGTEIGIRLLKCFDNIGTIVINGRVFLKMDLIMSGLFFILMSLVAISILKETSNKDKIKGSLSLLFSKFKIFQIHPVLSFPCSNVSEMSLWIPLSASVLVGILTGLLGVGGGFISFPILIYLIGVPTIVAVGTSAFQILLASGYGATRHYFQNHVNFILVLLLLIGSVIGVQMGVYASKFIGDKSLRRNFCWVILLGICIILFDLYCKLF